MSKITTLPSTLPRRAGRSFVIRVVAALAAMLLVVAFGSFGATHPASAMSRTLPGVSFADRVLEMGPGEERTVSVRLDKALNGGFDWKLVGVPATVTGELSCTRGLTCSLVLRAQPGTGPGVFLLELMMRRGNVERRAVLALSIRAAVSPTVPSTVAPPPPPSTIVAGNFSLRAAVLVRTLAPATTGVFGLELIRAGWSGPVTFTLEGVPAGWSANVSPNPTDASTNLYVTSSATAAPDDYSVRVIARSATSSAETTVVVRIRNPQVQVAVVTGPRVTVGGTSTFDIDARTTGDVFNGMTTVSFEGLPATITATVAANPVFGRTTVTLQAASIATAGSYNAVLVGRSGSAEARVPFLFVVDAATVSATTRFQVTAVPPIAGQPFGYGVVASPPSISVARGGFTTFNLVITPTGGFANIVDIAADVPSGWTTSYVAGGGNTLLVTVYAPATAVAGTAPAIVIRTQSGPYVAAISVTATVV